ncbi:F-box protein At5g46170-like [Ananas comosus]|uniref:F-box protein At5g46170-like n=1 Tax=Ananas comosus TaxID=4615 RepID=A0A6P5FII2_ANACO|nr:F-box protein At5g46170-like [Ananas comosus]
MSSSSCGSGGGGGGGEPSDHAAAEGVDHFDRLPDAIILVVLNWIGDVKALGRCSLVSRRFRFLVPFVDRVVDRPRGVLSHLSRFFFAGLVKPFQALGQIFSPASGHRRSSSSSSSSAAAAAESGVSHRSPTEVLKSFKVIRHLGIELPAGELTVDDGLLIKWKAGFGSTLDSCVILCASSVSPNSSNPNPRPNSHDPSLPDDDSSVSIPDSFYSSGKLKLRVVWTISALIAASARHYLLHPIIAEHATLQSLNLTDSDGQGELTMDARQLQELRVTPACAPGNSQRTLVPALSMLLWYAPLLELPAGLVLKGATLVAVRPNEEKGNAGLGSADVHGWVSNAFEEPYGMAARMLVNRRTYCLEMNSF